ncbi:MAG: B12-binding domain-containing radical SAM protein, partial [Vicinamibacterales bacterium]
GAGAAAADGADAGDRAAAAGGDPSLAGRPGTVTHLTMRVHLVNPSDLSFGTAVITPRWLYVLAAATPESCGAPLITDETLEPFDPATVRSGDVVGIGIHTANALRGYEVGRLARDRGATVVYGGVHATLYPDEARDHGAAHAVVKGDGDIVWPRLLTDHAQGGLQATYDGGRVGADAFAPARWDLLPGDRYMWGSVQTVRGCPKHCSFCSVWRTDGQQPRQRAVDEVIREVVELRRRGFRFILLADDNFYPVTLSDLAAAARRRDPHRLQELTEIRRQRFELMDRLARLPNDLVFYTQITMEAAEDPEFLQSMKRAHIHGALVGVESVTPEGLKAVYKDFNASGDGLVTQLQTFRRHGVHVLGSFIFGLPTDTTETFQATADVAQRAGVAFAQFVMLTPFPGTIDFEKWEKEAQPGHVGGTPLTRYWLIPSSQRPKVYMPHPLMSAEEIRRRTQSTWDEFYRLSMIWERSACVRSLRARLAFVLISKLYRQMYANTGIATDSARRGRSARWARWLAKSCRRLFVAEPMPHLEVPAPRVAEPAAST